LLEGEMWKSNAPKRPGKTPVAPGLVQWRLMTTFILELIQILWNDLLLNEMNFLKIYFSNGIIDN
jgi:hypothetical protein